MTEYPPSSTIESNPIQAMDPVPPMEQRIAIIDLGSNTCRLVSFAYTAHLAFKLVDQVSERLRIGEGMFADNRLQPEPMERAVQLLKMFHELAAANAIERVIATATSAVREATNRAEFLNRVRHEAGLELRVLSGAEEAYYAYLGTINSVALNNGIIADLGGGSLELTRVRERWPVAWASLPLGAVRLSEEFLDHDPIKKRQARALCTQIDEQLVQSGWPKLAPGEQLVVLGGTMRALAKIDQRTSGYPLDRLHGYRMSRRAVHQWANELAGRPLAARQKISGLKAERGDVIPAGAAVIWRLMKWLDAKHLTVSGQGLREGLFYEAFLNDSLPRLWNADTLVPNPGFQVCLPPGVSAVPLLPDVRAFGIANLGDVYAIDWTHAEQVCDLALALFDQLRNLHRLTDSERALLAAAALLHDVGVVVDYYRHHLHSAYVIVNADLPGFSQREVALMALLVRWHRHGNPSLKPYEPLLDGEDWGRVQKLAALLRLAEDLERSRAQVVRGVRCLVDDQLIEVRALTRGPAGAELWAANRNSDIFRAAYARELCVTGVAEAAALEPLARSLISSQPENIIERAAQLATRLNASMPSPAHVYL